MMDNLQKLYAEIDQRGHQALLAHQEAVDPYLTTANDDRRGLSLIFHLPAHISRNIAFVLQALQNVEPDLYCYPASDMHITAMDIIGARPNFHLVPDQEKRYRQVVKTTVAGTPVIGWHLSGLVLSPGAVMVKGYYSPALQMLRRKLRTNLTRAGLAVHERYQTRSGHVTVARFAQPLRDPSAVVKLIDANRSLPFGDFTSHQMDLVIHDWYNHWVQPVDTFTLAE